MNAIFRRRFLAALVLGGIVLTPTVGVAPPEVDEDFDFEQTLRDIHVELADLNKEAVELAEKIQRNLEGLGV